MGLHYQVTSTYAFKGGSCKASLVGLTLHTTFGAWNLWPEHTNQKNFLEHFRIFPSLSEAEAYISHLRRTFKHCAIPQPVLDGGQINLF
jgi:hypothetical protein